MAAITHRNGPVIGLTQTIPFKNPLKGFTSRPRSSIITVKSNAVKTHNKRKGSEKIKFGGDFKSVICGGAANQQR